MSREDMPNPGRGPEWQAVDPFHHHRAVTAMRDKTLNGAPVSVQFAPDDGQTTEEMRAHTFLTSRPGFAKPKGFTAHAEWRRPIFYDDTPDTVSSTSSPIVLYSANPENDAPPAGCLARISEASGRRRTGTFVRQYALWADYTASMLTAYYPLSSDMPRAMVLRDLDDNEVLALAEAVEAATPR